MGRARIGNRYGITADDLKEIVLEEFTALSQAVLTNENYAFEMLLKYKGLTNNEIRLMELKSKPSFLINEGSNLFRLKLSK